MGAEIKKIENLDRMTKIYDELLQEAVKQLMSDVLLEIVKLTNKGLNARNHKFRPYAKSTRIHKAKTGRSTTPNMQETSSMMSSLLITRLRETTPIVAYKIGVTGSDINGVSNTAKMASLRNHKNYIILEWSKHYKTLVNKHLKVFLERFIRTVSRMEGI